MVVWTGRDSSETVGPSAMLPLSAKDTVTQKAYRAPEEKLDSGLCVEVRRGSSHKNSERAKKRRPAAADLLFCCFVCSMRYCFAGSLNELFRVTMRLNTGAPSFESLKSAQK